MPQRFRNQPRSEYSTQMLKQSSFVGQEHAEQPLSQTKNIQAFINWCLRRKTENFIAKLHHQQ